MPKKRREGAKNLNKGPFTAADFDRALRSDGWYRVPGGKHWNYKHPTKPGKVQVASNWEHVKYGKFNYVNVAENSGLGKMGLLKLLNGLDL